MNCIICDIFCGWPSTIRPFNNLAFNNLALQQSGPSTIWPFNNLAFNNLALQQSGPSTIWHSTIWPFNKPALECSGQVAPSCHGPLLPAVIDR
jgi:hypothetical protein